MSNIMNEKLMVLFMQTNLLKNLLCPHKKPFPQSVHDIPLYW